MLGMLWLDTSELSLNDKILKAKDYYNRKYGKCNVCYVLGIEPFEIHDLKIKPMKIPANHFWIGWE